MNNTIRKISIFGLIFMSTYLVISGLFYIIGANSSFCLSCFIILTGLNFLPLLLLKVKGVAAIIISAIFYFALGALIGYLVEKFKK